MSILQTFYKYLFLRVFSFGLTKVGQGGYLAW